MCSFRRDSGKPIVFTLPDDIATLRRLLIGRDEMIAKLMVKIARLKRWRFGRFAEQTDAALLQLQLALSALHVSAADAVALPKTVPVDESTTAPPLKQSTSLRRVSRAFPADLPRETMVCAPASGTCPDCGAAMRKLAGTVAPHRVGHPGTRLVGTGARGHKTKTGRLWTYVRDDRPAASRDPPAVWYRYSPDRKGERPRVPLKRFCGILHSQPDSMASAARNASGATLPLLVVRMHQRICAMHQYVKILSD